jgi:hypothetical protein
MSIQTIYSINYGNIWFSKSVPVPAGTLKIGSGAPLSRKLKFPLMKFISEIIQIYFCNFQLQNDTEIYWSHQRCTERCFLRGQQADRLWIS